MTGKSTNIFFWALGTSDALRRGRVLLKLAIYRAKALPNTCVGCCWLKRADRLQFKIARFFVVGSIVDATQTKRMPEHDRVFLRVLDPLEEVAILLMLLQTFGMECLGTERLGLPLHVLVCSTVHQRFDLICPSTLEATYLPGKVFHWRCNFSLF